MTLSRKSVWLENSPPEGGAIATIAFAHGAGAPMDSDYMNTMAGELALAGVNVIRFEFAYMQQRRLDGKRRPPPKAENLIVEFRDVVAGLSATHDNLPLFIGGKSMGGRIASLLAADSSVAGSDVAGCFCAGYPFHPPGKPDRWRTDHFSELAVPVRIVQGTRDPFGKQDEVTRHLAGLGSDTRSVRVTWLESGEHDFKPTKASGRVQKDLIESAAKDVANWMRTVIQ